MTDEDMQRKYMEMQMMGQQINQVQQQVMEAERQLLELETIKEALHELPNKKVGDEILVPINQGIYMKGQIKDTQNFIINVGSQVAVQKTAKQAQEMVESQISKLRDLHLKLASDMQTLTGTLQRMEQNLGA